MIFRSNSPEATAEFASDFAAKLKPGAIVFLRGEMGSGKTAFVQSVLKALGCKDTVTSPTFTLCCEYVFENKKALHYDLYRLSSYDDLFSIGFFDNEADYIFVEWPQCAMEHSDDNYILMDFQYGDNESERIISYDDTRL